MQNKQIRLNNLRHLIKREGAVSQLALRLQISPIYIYRVLDGKFNIGDSMARKIEDAYGFPLGWMDSPQGDLAGPEPEVPVLGVEQRVEPPRAEVADERPAAPAGVTEGLRPKLAEPTRAQPPKAPVRPAAAVAPAVPESRPVPEKPVPAAAEGEGEIPDTLNERIVMGLINTLNRILAAHGLEVSDMEKAKLLMKVAEKILDQKKPSSGNDGQKPFLKIS